MELADNDRDIAYLSNILYFVFIPESCETYEYTLQTEQKMWDLRFPQRWLWSVSSSGIWRRVVRLVSTDVSEEHIASIFRIEEISSANQRASRWLAESEDGSDMFLQNVCWNSTYYTASYPRRWYSSEQNIFLSSKEMVPLNLKRIIDGTTCRVLVCGFLNDAFTIETP
jgi:hypothetical protein